MNKAAVTNKQFFSMIMIFLMIFGSSGLASAAHSLSYTVSPTATTYVKGSSTVNRNNGEQCITIENSPDKSPALKNNNDYKLVNGNLQNPTDSNDSGVRESDNNIIEKDIKVVVE